MLGRSPRRRPAEPLTATATITGAVARVTLAAAYLLLASAEIDGDGMFAIAGAAGIIATFDFSCWPAIMFAEGDIYAFGELENVLFAQVRRKAAGILAALAETTLDGRVRYASAAAVTGMAEITKAVGGRERRDAPTLLAQVITLMLAGRSGPGGYAAAFPSAVMTGALVEGTTGATHITARGKIEDFAPGAVVYRIVSASLFGGASITGTARRDTASSGAVAASGAMIGKGGLLQRAVSGPLASGDVEAHWRADRDRRGWGAECPGAAGRRGAADDLREPTPARRRDGNGDWPTGDVRCLGPEGAWCVNVVATGGYQHRAAASLVASADVAGPNGGYLVKGAAALAVSATATLGGRAAGLVGPPDGDGHAGGECAADQACGSRTGGDGHGDGGWWVREAGPLRLSWHGRRLSWGPTSRSGPVPR